MTGYQVLQKLADGSATEVFLAREESTHDHVILEVIRPELTTDSDVYGRFLEEAKARRDLNHPHLLQRRTAGYDGQGRIFVVTEPVAGEHLGSYLAAHGPLSSSDVVWMMLAICDALEYLHARELVHGALRPANVFLCGPPSARVPKLLDTGLFLFRSPRSAVTTKILVEPEYLCPERIRGQRANIRSDVYGLGVLMFEALCGKPPFTSPDPAQTRRKHLEDEPPLLPPSTEALAPIILRCLAKTPSRRFPSAAAVREALTDLVSKHSSGTRRLAPPSASHPAAEPIPDTGGDELVGTTLGSYRIESILGRGGMGRVYLARHVKLGRKAAIKVPKATRSDAPAELERFFREARLVNEINHEHIIQIYDFVEEPPEAGGRVYCVMEFLEGETLTESLKREPMSLGKVLGIARQICGALTAAHAAGVVHRDLKPDNIFLIDKNGQTDFVKVLDFGAAKLYGTSLSITDFSKTTPGLVVGTPSYMAPEQALEQPVDGRTDIYALATLLYKLLSGRLPFEGVSLGSLIAKLATLPPHPLPNRTPAGEQIPEPLAELVLRCLAKKPEDRIQSMAAFSSALAAFEDETPAAPVREARAEPNRPSAPPPTPEEESRIVDLSDEVDDLPPTGKRKWIAVGVGIALLLALGLFAATHRTERVVEKPAPAAVEAPHPKK